MVRSNASSASAALLRLLPFSFFLLPSAAAGEMVLIEAESFATLGGWVVDQQFMDQMGSPFLLAHGLGVPVADATTTINFPATGAYSVFVRTRDWVAPHGPGKFKLLVNGAALEPVFGTEGEGKWIWQKGGAVEVARPEAALALRDLSGFEGRCDAILFVKGAPDYSPPEELGMQPHSRKALLGLPADPPEAGRFDLVVVGGGLAGCAAAVAAARLNLKVALIQDRPVLGGNNSSEVRVWLGGKLGGPPFPSNADVVKELAPKSGGYGAGGRGYEEGDEKKLGVIQAEKNIALFLNHHAYAVEKEQDRIAAVLSRDIRTARELRFRAPLFVDCTGDGAVGFLAGAEYRYGREGRDETGEPTAPLRADKLHMGPSNLWGAENAGQPSAFPPCPWALEMPDAYMRQTAKAMITRGDWTWETGFNWDAIAEAERIRDHNFRAMYGTWDYLKNRGPDKEKYACWKLSWCAYVAGKRESRRLVGDHVLNELDIKAKKLYPDGCVTTTWSLDLHSPTAVNSQYFPGEEFRSRVAGGGGIAPYPVPFRCLYSKNVANLLMAGRCISVTHVALGTVRVMNTCGMMGVVVGRAAYVCKKHACTPREIYEKHLEELKQVLTEPRPGE
jgi:hypothetical protein